MGCDKAEDLMKISGSTRTAKAINTQNLQHLQLQTATHIKAVETFIQKTSYKTVTGTFFLHEYKPADCNYFYSGKVLNAQHGIATFTGITDLKMSPTTAWGLQIFSSHPRG